MGATSGGVTAIEVFVDQVADVEVDVISQRAAEARIPGALLTA